jgi:hypothetical protein
MFDSLQRNTARTAIFGKPLYLPVNPKGSGLPVAKL